MQIDAGERLAARQKHHRHAHGGEVVSDPLHFIERALPHVGVGINDVALLAGEIAAGGDVELYVNRRVLQERRARQGKNRKL